jgi:pimeloyl-ACP methyl ester carboxylesterase
VLEAFDVVGFDPRGTGRSEPAIDCVDDYDHFAAVFDGAPDPNADDLESALHRTRASRTS